MIYITYNSENGKVDEIAFSLLEMIPQGKPYLEISEEDWNNAQGKIMKVEDGQFIYTEPPPTLEDYDKAMEDHLREERIARGYTLREPSDYKGSSVERWNQDAEDWIAHRDEVMLYGLEVMNTYKETGEAPTLDEFKKNLPIIQWTLN